ncbi:TRAP transporter small permease subunit [Microvirga tunisiensis]|uniref:TRAP transporter small permease protein n=1 Tax=Microvirga tunisiensis TaxID=2108360 RepID=A0A5N7MBT8_9HYPH|nr:TRAP transporter small permease [Microvirga tunisiensis]MPR05508.1 TRAP transporter small permease [Microvirga tunisiensis]MPR23709.1 TRAP transporter small permease [Microvirga tunisiensis]
MERIYDHVERVSQLASWVGGAAVLAIALMVTFDVLARNLLGVTITNAPEVAGYIFAAAIAFSFPIVVIRRANIRIDTLYVLLPTPAARLLDVIGAFVLCLSAGVIAYFAAQTFWESWQANSTSISSLSARLWIPQLFWAAGLVLFFAMTVFITAYATIAFFRRRWSDVERIAGLPSPKESLVDES